MTQPQLAQFETSIDESQSLTTETSRCYLLLFTIAILASPALSDLVFSKVDRRIYLTSHIVRVSSTIKVENVGPEMVSDVLLAFPDQQAKNMAYLMATPHEGKGKVKNPAVALPVEAANPKGMPPALTFYSVPLPKGLAEGDSFTFDVLAVFSHALRPIPEKITQADIQLVVYHDNAHYLSPYVVKAQSLTVKLPDSRIESYTKLDNTKIHGSEIKYGPYENLPAFSYSPIAVHFESNQPFAVAQELVREIEISHWGNVQVTEHYKLIHGGAQSKGEFSRLNHAFSFLWIMARPNVRGASAFRYLVVNLPPRAHSVYYRYEIGNISTSHLRGDSKKTELLIEPRYPMFGAWRTAFTIGYGLPLQDFLYESEGKRFLNITYSSPMVELVIDTLIVKVVLPEGSSDISVAAPFPVEQWRETKISHLDIDGRPVVVLKKINVVPEHNQYFQDFSSSLLLALFTCEQTYQSPSLLLLIWLNSTGKRFRRTGDIQACKAARKATDGLLKELSKELKPLLTILQSSPSAAQVLPKVEELVAKERELQENVMVKHSKVVDGYEKKSGACDIENRVAFAATETYSTEGRS
ncbi:hypothetical protein V6N12_057199 [Hibiscus sabdariffa]|uniref:Dolichyl-diphosphooligosaccharide--protein glycosyltransferase subunit 1 n=1 Tax=Hibiscus sabdariffa TaxID=183260 RepID=A0ABR1ZU13_9ROSI